jgi:hypothetical protein
VIENAKEQVQKLELKNRYDIDELHYIKAKFGLFKPKDSMTISPKVKNKWDQGYLNALKEKIHKEKLIKQKKERSLRQQSKNNLSIAAQSFDLQPVISAASELKKSRQSPDLSRIQSRYSTMKSTEGTNMGYCANSNKNISQSEQCISKLTEAIATVSNDLKALEIKFNKMGEQKLRASNFNNLLALRK